MALLVRTRSLVLGTFPLLVSSARGSCGAQPKPRGSGLLVDAIPGKPVADRATPQAPDTKPHAAKALGGSTPFGD